MRQEGTPDTFIEHLLAAWSTHRYPSTPPTQPLGWGFSHYPVLQTGVSVAIGVEAGGPRTQHSTLMAPEMPVLTSLSAVASRLGGGQSQPRMKSITETQQARTPAGRDV